MTLHEPLAVTVLLASAQELFLAIAFIFLALWFVLKVATDRMRTQGPPGPRPPRPLMRPDARPGPARPAPPGPVDPREEVAEFLRRAQQRRQEGGPKRTSSLPERKPRPVAGPQPPARPAAKPAVLKPATPPVVKEVAKPAESPLGRRLGDRMATSSGLGSGAAPERLPTLGSDVGRRSLEMEFYDPYEPLLGRLRGAADTKGDSVQSASGEADRAALTATAAGIVEILNSGDRLRTMVILNEVLQRPIDRWE